MPCRNLCRFYIHLAFTCSVGPSSMMWSKLRPSLPFPPIRVLEVNCSRAFSLVCEMALEGQFTQVPSSKTHITRGEYVQSQPLRTRKLGLTTSHRVPSPSPNCDIDAYMATLLEMRLGSRVESRAKLKARFNPQHKSHDFFDVEYLISTWWLANPNWSHNYFPRNY
jgi:hypothetical protein